MNRLPQACRQALLKQSGTSASKLYRKWSLVSLANIGRTQSLALPDTCASTVDIRKKAADTLLREVQNRLAQQYNICGSIKHAIEGEVQSPHSDATKHSHNKQTGTIIVRAVNTPLAEMRMKSSAAFSAIRKLILDLEDMHADTYRLIWELYARNSEEPAILRNFHSANEALISSVFDQIRSRHAHSVEALADIVVSHRSSIQSTDSKTNTVEEICAKFLKGRIGVQLLCDHYVRLHKQSTKVISDEVGTYNIGAVNINCDIWDIIRDSVAEALAICETNLQVVPDVLVGNTASKEGLHAVDNIMLADPRPVNITLIKAWAHHCMVEIFKNAMQAVVERNPQKPPSIIVTVSSTEKHVTVRVRDHGVGLESEDVEKAFQFALTGSSSEKWDRLNEQQSYAAVTTPIRGLGVGLPLSRLMMETFGGFLELESAEDASGGCIATLVFSRDFTVEESHMTNDGQHIT